MQESWKITKSLTNGYSFENTHRELSNDYQPSLDVFKNICVLVLWTKVALALSGLRIGGSFYHFILKGGIYWSIENEPPNACIQYRHLIPAPVDRTPDSVWL